MQLFPSRRPVLMIFGGHFDEEEKLQALLSDECDVQVTEDVQTALKTALEKGAQKALLVDSSLDRSVISFLCSTLQEDYRAAAMPILFYGRRDDDSLLDLYEMGATGHFNLPIPAELMAFTVKAQLRFNSRIDLVRLIGEQLEEAVNRRKQEAVLAEAATILAMATLAEARDSETAKHIQRTQRYIRALCERLRGVRKFSAQLTDAAIDRLFRCAPLHDIGKVSIPDHIVLKTGPLTQEEFEIMKAHTTLGKQAIENAEKQFGARLEFLTIAKEIAYSHQEKWDGTGYPQGLRGEAIPLSARLMALADVYDALISRSAYKDPISHDMAVEIILSLKGSHFDPDLVDAFEHVHKHFEEIAEQFQDTDKDLQQKKAMIDQMSHKAH